MRRLLAILILLTGCQTTQVVTNQPLPETAQNKPEFGGGYRLTDMLRDPQGEVLVVLAFSGGGKRSAAFAHGALRGLRDVIVQERRGPRRLLADVDYIAAVSGGSFPAMHYGLYRDRSFDTFEADFLKRDIEAFIWGIYLLPWNWEWLVNPLFGTNDAMAEIYDRLMFHGATYADLLARGLPLISVNATDIANGLSFPFIQPSFDLLCSDLLSFPVARAVAASNAFPVLFSPITLVSHTAACRGVRPPGAPPAEWADETGTLSRRAALARATNRYLDPEQTRYVHLMDGGIADNLALRGVLNGLIALDDSTEEFHVMAQRIRRVLVISIDGQAAANPTLGQQRVVTGLGQIFSAVSGAQIDAYNFETLLLAEAQVQRLVARLRTVRCAGGKLVAGTRCDDVRGALVHIALAGVPDPAERARLQAIRTGLTIPDADVDTLIAYGEKLVVENPQIRALTDGLDQPALQASAR